MVGLHDRRAVIAVMNRVWVTGKGHRVLTHPRFSTSVRPAVERMDAGGCGSDWTSTAGTVEVSQLDTGAAATSGNSATMRTCSSPGRRPPTNTRRMLSQD